MGYQFSLETANILARFLPSRISMDGLDDDWMEENRHQVERFLHEFEGRFHASPEIEHMMHVFFRDFHRGRVPQERFLIELRSLFAGRIPWYALIIPSGIDQSTDRLLTNRSLLMRIVDQYPEHPGLILMLDRPPKDAINLLNLFPTFKKAMARRAEWPGILIWNFDGEAIFLPLSKIEDESMRMIDWIFHRDDGMYRHRYPFAGSSLSSFEDEFIKKFYDKESCNVINILHMSDLHIGEKIAQRRMSRVQQLISNIVQELPDESIIFPVVTGDIIDSPSNDYQYSFEMFHQFMVSLGTESPIYTLGNHDIRASGILNNNYQVAQYIPHRSVHSHPKHDLIFAVFNSSESGTLARGEISESQMINIGNTLDQSDPAKYKIALVHHHPLPVQKPEWHQKTWYEKLLGAYSDQTQEFINADIFMAWVKERSFVCALHGHKHIPRFLNRNNELPVIGCGSTTGLVPTSHRGEVYISINHVSINPKSNMLYCALRAERLPGAGLKTTESHQILLRNNL